MRFNKLFLSIFFLFLLGGVSQAATYYAIQGGGNWNSSSTWAASTGQTVGGAGTPTATDDVIVDGTLTGTVTINATTCVAKSLDATSSAGTINFSSGQKLTVSGNVSLGGTISGTSTLAINATSTITPNGVTFPGVFSIGAVTVTLASDFNVGSLATTGAATLNGAFNLNDAGGLSLVTGGISGTATIVFTGTGTWSGNQLTVSNNVTINTSGTITLSNAQTLNYNTRTFKYISGTVVATGNTLAITGNATFDTNGMNFNNVQLSGNTTTLLSNFQCTGEMHNRTSGTYPSPIFSGAFNITAGSFSLWPTISSVSFTMPAGQTLTVTSTLTIVSIGSFTSTMKSGTSSSSMNLVFSGQPSGQKVSGAIFTDVDASSSPRSIYNWVGGTLTRTAGIYNVNMSNLGGFAIF